MGFALSILYFITYYLTPVTLFGPLAEYRIELILAVLVSIASLGKLAKSFIWRTQQTLALFGLGLATLLSGVFGMHYARGGVIGLLGFLPDLLAYLLVCLHCDSKKKLQIVAGMLLFVCLFVIAQGYVSLRNAPAAGSADLEQDHGEGYIMQMGSDAGTAFYRIRGLGEINDPNDFGQVVVCTIPLMFLFWSPKKTLKNVAFVILPICALLYGIYLTHSRGAMLALLAMAVVAARRRIRTFPALLMATVLYAVATALNFTGGRGISAAAGEDRTLLWGGSMELIKAHPLFGVGLGNLPDYLGITAHNSVMVCAAELGLVGLCFWCLFLLNTVRDALTIATPEKVGERDVAVAGGADLPRKSRVELLEEGDIVRMGRLMVLSLTGFLVAGWFLSRAYVLTLFLLGGIAEVMYEMAVRQGMTIPRLRLGRSLPYTGLLAASLIVLMYVFLRTVNLTH